jgi:hypothetical protein
VSSHCNGVLEKGDIRRIVLLEMMMLDLLVEGIKGEGKDGEVPP